MTTHLVWFRHDLRITDHSALHAACQNADAKVVALYIATPGQWQAHGMAPRQATFLLQNLQALQQSLAAKGIPLFYQQCEDFHQAVETVDAFCKKQHVSHLFYHYQYEINERERDRALEAKLHGQVVCQGFDDSVLLAPGSLVTGKQEMYKVFTPFRKAFIQRLLEMEITCFPAPKKRANVDVGKLDALSPFDYPQQAVDETLFPAGEQAALARLRQFCQSTVADYYQQRDFPAQQGTSQLSPYLALGVISPRQCLNRLRAEHPNLLEQSDGGAFTWLSELIWREFYRHLLVAWPRLCKHRPFVEWTQQVQWRQDEKALIAWQQGKTGFPIVDAAMRQLNGTGWMHNRLRMICASFLVKDLLIDWRAGERYFISQLLDGDLAANNGGWQWAASTGTDAAPYFRIFNPTTQGERFDPQGTFIRQWVPELAEVPERDIHQPHRWAQREGRRLDYPTPMVDHKQARQMTLEAFEAAKALQEKGQNQAY
ncbi:deoxyribodipyrimidine photo-lyase [Symbiopectobacterium sp. Eva_TO]